jgi:hypothetical protein
MPPHELTNSTSPNPLKACVRCPEESCRHNEMYRVRSCPAIRIACIANPVSRWSARDPLNAIPAPGLLPEMRRVGGANLSPCRRENGIPSPRKCLRCRSGEGSEGPVTSGGARWPITPPPTPCRAVALRNFAHAHPGGKNERRCQKTVGSIREFAIGPTMRDPSKECWTHLRNALLHGGMSGTFRNWDAF